MAACFSYVHALVCTHMVHQHRHTHTPCIISWHNALNDRSPISYSYASSMHMYMYAYMYIHVRLTVHL